MGESKEESKVDQVTPIAVVGLGCRFPGSATSGSSLWGMLTAGESAWSEIPADRMDLGAVYHPDNDRQGSIPFRGGHFLKQNVGAFDNSFFSISADEAKAMDPQQRMLLEVAVEALDNAGIDRTAIRGSESGVWVGSFVKDYEQVVFRDPDNAPKYGATGNGTAIMSNRISFFLDLNGPSMTIDTGCSASLVCVHQACQALREGDIDMALAGGCGLILTPSTMMPMTALNFLSPDGKCYTFDSRANGYGRGEGIGMVVLKRLDDAIRDNDSIRAVIRGSRVNQDGRTAGITLPSAESQMRNIVSAYEKAGLDFDQTAFVECHGTGTKAGDWREVKAISKSVSSCRTKENPLYIGSIKTNIGHLEGSAGVAGLIKGVLACENGCIPKHINFETPNPDIDFDGLGVKVPTQNTPWPQKGLRRTSINCFGFGGTNAHVILDDAAHYLAKRGLKAHHNTTIPTGSDEALLSLAYTAAPGHHARDTTREIEGLRLPPRNGDTQLFVVSANDRPTLERSLRNLAAYVQAHRASSPRFLCDLAYTLGCRRTNLQWRAAVVAASPEELVEKLSAVSQASLMIRTPEEKLTRAAFVFGGQGAQWFAMARELLGFDSFLASVVEANRHLKQIDGGCSFDLLEELLKDAASSRINEPEIAQPATTVVQTSLVDLLLRFGVAPVAVCGHSSGEIAAAYAVGAISKADAWELAYYRGQCAASLQGETGHPAGRMLAAGISAEQAQQYVDAVGPSKVTIACINSPVSVTLSGDEDAVVSIHETLEKAGIFSRLLAVTTAYHSHHMKRCDAMYRQSIAHISPNSPPPSPPASPLPVMYSSVTGNAIEWEELSPDYWARNLTSPVLFADAMLNLASNDAGHRPDLLIEIGPHSALQGPIKQIFDAQKKLKQIPPYFSLLSRRKDASVTTLQVLGELWSRGCSFTLKEAIARNEDYRHPHLLVNLPNYPWNHEKVHWHESHISKASRFPKHGRYDLIGRLSLDSIPSQPRWKGFLRLSENPWIKHHQVQNTVLYPASGMIAMVLEGAKQMTDAAFAGIEIKEFRIGKALIVPPTAHGLEYVVNMTKDTGRNGPFFTRNSDTAAPDARTLLTYYFSIYSKPLEGAWQEHGDGLVIIHQAPAYETEKYRQSRLHANAVCDETLIPRQLYETLDVIGLNYGPMFRNITSLRKSDTECLSTIRIPDTRSIMPAKFEFPHMVHPTTLDSVIHTALALESEPMVPTNIGSIFVSATPKLSSVGHELMTHTQAVRSQSREASATFVVYDNVPGGSSQSSSFEPLIVVKDMTFTALTTNSDVVRGFLPYHRNLCSEIKWEEFKLDSSLTQVPAEVNSDQSMPVLVLIPEVVSPSLDNLLSAIQKELNAIPRTLLSISSDETLPTLCLSLLEADGHNLLWDLSEQEYAALRTVVLKSDGLFWVTRGSQIDVSEPRGALFQAFARTIHSEYPQKTLVTFDIAKDTDFSEDSAAGLSRRILALFRKSFTSKPSSDAPEPEYVEREGRIMVPRLVPVGPLNAIIEHGTASAEPESQSTQGRSFMLKIRESGDLDSLCWADDETAHSRLSSKDVRIRSVAMALTALDADIVMGRAPDGGIGTDIFGTVEEVGEDVTDLSPGDFVLGIARGTLRDTVVCPRELLYKCPEGKIQPYHVFFPTPFAIAQYSFGDQLQKGESILIHAAGSDFGQAAIQLALSIGARLFVTVKNKHERAVLRSSYNIPKEHILDADSEAWVDEVLRLTDNEGVKVVYDPTIENGDVQLEGIIEGGHIIRFTRKENVSGTLDTVNRAITFMSLDIAHLIAHEPAKTGAAFAAVCAAFLADNPDRVSEPAPLKIYDYSQLPFAFRHIVEDGAYGVVYTRRSDELSDSATVPAVPILPRPLQSVDGYLRGNATYVFSGGLGGIGIEIAKLLAANGAKHLAFINPSGARTDLAKAGVKFLENRGVEVAVFAIDICDAERLEWVSRDIANRMPPVKGVFQCAARMRDAVFENLTYANWRDAVRPKTVGSWNLARCFASGPWPLDFFVFLSSSIGVIGGRGQANYAVGNAFQDALAIHLNKRKEATAHAVSLDLGPVLGAGMLAEDPRTLDMLKAAGFFGIRLQDVMKVVERAIAGHMGPNGVRMPAQVVVGVGTGGIVKQINHADPYWTRMPLFRYLNQIDLPPSPASSDSAEGSSDNKKKSMVERLQAAASPEEAATIIATGFRTMLAQQMNANVDDVDENRSTVAYGVDSLIAVSMRNWVFRECGSVSISVFDVLSDQSILELSQLIVQKGGFGNGGGGD